ncbi:MAG: superoxide dismutase [Phycisphaerae bacterium]
MHENLTRRDALKLAGVAGAGVVLASAGCSSAQEIKTGQGLATGMAGAIDKQGTYSLPELPYAYDALEPLYDQQTLRIHHDKHHAGYVRGLNSVLEKLDAARKSGDLESIKALSRGLAFHGSGHVLHTIFWNSMTPGGSEPSRQLQSMMNGSFGSVKACQSQFAAATKAVEASGWGVLAWEPIANKLLVMQAEKHQNLTIWGVLPLLVCDVWEHAYYLKYQNNRGQWVDNFMKLANWDYASKRLASIRG